MFLCNERSCRFPLAMLLPRHKTLAPPEWSCPNAQRGLQTVDCWCGKSFTDEPDPPIFQDLFKSQRHYAQLLKKEPYEDMRRRLLSKGQRQLKSQGDYLLSHMGLNRQQVQRWKETDSERRDRLMRTSSLPSYDTASMESWASGSSERPSTAISMLERRVPQDPVQAILMNGAPSFSPNMSGLAAAALAKPSL
mmetsp:Transcript_37819/g.87554  ORF Transcript_37819/g.87554 Transcript_37819/m.87554 type:complete len:193 (+) Transcript_37819:2-580(+)